MKKIEIVESEKERSKYRLIINPEENLSIGVILTKADLNNIKIKIEEILEEAKN